VEVLHRRRDVGVAHPLLDPADVGYGDHPRAERVAQVVEAQRPEAGSLQRRLVATRERGRVEPAADDSREDEIVLVGPELPLAQSGQRLGDRRRERDGTDLAALGRGQPPARVRTACTHAMRHEVDAALIDRLVHHAHMITINGTQA
jgi:hypothetical protein